MTEKIWYAITCFAVLLPIFIIPLVMLIDLRGKK